YSPSPKRSLISRTIASSAACSSSPSVSISISAPMPAASIITPMMLLALTLRPLRLMKTSLLKPVASLVSLAEARACRPSLLLMVTVVLIIGTGFVGLVLRSRRSDLHHPLRGARHRAGDQHVERVVAVAQRPPQHGHVHT